MNDIAKICVDHYKNKVTQFSEDETEQVIRKALFDCLGIEKFENRTQFRRAMRNHPEVFSVIEEVIDQVIANGEGNTLLLVRRKTAPQKCREMYRVLEEVPTGI